MASMPQFFVSLQTYSKHLVVLWIKRQLPEAIPAFNSKMTASMSRSHLVCSLFVLFPSSHKHCEIKFSSGPTTLLANHIVGDPIASDLHCGAAYWTFEMRENRCLMIQLKTFLSCLLCLFTFITSCSAWACGLVPVTQTVAGNKNVLWDRQQSIGLHYGGSGCCFEKIDAPKGVEVTVFVDFNSKTCKFCRNGKVIVVKSVPEAEFPLRLGICGHSGTTFNIKPDKVPSAECLMAAQVGDSIFSSQVSAKHQALPLPSGGAVGGKVMAASDKSLKQLTFLRLEFSSGMEYDLWRRALLHTVPALTIDSGQSLSSSDSSPKPDAGKAAEKQVEPLKLLFSFLADTRVLCEERYASELFHYFLSYSLFEAVMFVWNEFGLRKVRFSSHHFHCCPLLFQPS
jgi:hypothetical protein